MKYLFQDSEILEQTTDQTLLQVQELQNQMQAIQKEINLIHKKLDKITSKEKTSFSFSESELPKKKSFSNTRTNWKR